MNRFAQAKSIAIGRAVAIAALLALVFLNRSKIGSPSGSQVSFMQANALWTGRRALEIRQHLMACDDSSTILALELRRLVDRCVGTGMVQHGTAILIELREIVASQTAPCLDDAAIRDLEAVVGEAVEHPSTQASDEIVNSLRRARVAHAARMAVLAGKFQRLGYHGHAHSCTLQVVKYDPDHALARIMSLVAYEPASSAWVPTCTQPGFRSGGRVWDRELGWVFEGHQEKYTAGLYPQMRDREPLGWKPLQQLDREHTSIRTPWVVKTRHFTIRISTGLKTGVSVANALESFYVPFMVELARLSGDSLSNLLRMNTTPANVHILHSLGMVHDYRRAFGGDERYLVDSTICFYDPARDVAVVGLGSGVDPAVAARHEVAHLLASRFLPIVNFADPGSSSVWEGLATWAESASLRNGRLVARPAHLLHVYGVDANAVVAAEAHLVDVFRWHPEVFFGPREQRRFHYALAGCWTGFFLAYRDGALTWAYREYLFSRSRGDAAHSLAEHCGLSEAQLDAEMKLWVTDHR